MTKSIIHARIHTPMAMASAGETIDERILWVRQQPEGYYWLDEEMGRACGPFGSLDDTFADMNRAPARPIECCQACEDTQPPDDRVDRDPAQVARDTEPGAV